MKDHPMRLLLALPLMMLLVSCAPAPAVKSAGPPPIQERSLCRPPAEKMEVVLPQDVRLTVLAEYGAKEIRVGMRVNAGPGRATVRLLGARARLSTAPGYALVIAAADGKGGNYRRAAGDERDAVAIAGKPLQEIDMGSGSIDYSVPEFFGTSSVVTLPALSINGQRVDIAPVSLGKKAGFQGSCAHS